MTFNELEKLAEECEALLEKYAKNLEKQVFNAIHEVIDTHSAKTLRDLKRHIELNSFFCGNLRFMIRNQEKVMEGLLKGINNKLISQGEKTLSTFYIPKEKEVPIDISCPYCGKKNKKFTYGELCKTCHELIDNPWKEHTICPNCSKAINRSRIFTNKEDYKYDQENNFVTCDNPKCLNRFDWKQHRVEPQKFGLKSCIKCDMPYNPDKRNWKKQRLCQNCKAKGVDSHREDNPDYQKKYRKKIRRGKK